MEEIQFEERQYVVFKLDREVFGLPISTVKEIIVYQSTTGIPGTSHYIEGVINLRGRVIPIYDLRKRFGFPSADITRSTRIVVVEIHGTTVGIIVDGVSEVMMISGSVIEKPNSFIASGIDEQFVAGIAKMEENLVSILDLSRVINPGMLETKQSE